MMEKNTLQRNFSRTAFLPPARRHSGIAIPQNRSGEQLMGILSQPLKRGNAAGDPKASHSDAGNPISELHRPGSRRTHLARIQ